MQYAYAECVANVYSRTQLTIVGEHLSKLVLSRAVHAKNGNELEAETNIFRTLHHKAQNHLKHHHHLDIDTLYLD